MMGVASIVVSIESVGGSIKGVVSRHGAVVWLEYDISVIFPPRE
jgi:hypothetical protein